MQSEKTTGPPPRGVLSFTSRTWLAGGLICLSPLLIGSALAQYDHGTEMDHFAAMLMFLLLATTVMAFLLMRDQPAQMAPFLMTGIVLLLAIYLRAACLNEVTGDYMYFLSPWMSYMRENGGLAALKTLQSDYNMPYLYLLALFSYLPVDSLLLVKFISIVGDLLLAWTAVTLARELGLSENKRLLLLAGILFTPTIWLNSAFWAQCDVLYTLFALLCFLYVLRGRPWYAVCMAGLAFAFKLQAIFFLPMLAVFLLTRRLNWKHLLAFPGVYLLAGLPALALGRPFVSLFSIYGTQVGLYSEYLSLNAPSAYALLSGNAPVAPFFAAGLVAAALFLCYFFYRLMQRGKPIGNLTLLTIALAFCAVIPWLLPSMHERYYYMADVLAVCYAVLHPKRFYVAPLMIYASWAGYHAYLFNEYRPFSMWAPALMVAAVGGIALWDLRAQLREDAALEVPESVPVPAED